MYFFLNYMIGKGKTYKEVQPIIGRASKMLSNEFKGQQEHGNLWNKISNFSLNKLKNSPDPVNHHFQTDQR